MSEKTEEGSVIGISEQVSSLLFTSLCRALGIETRLICSLFPIPLSLAKQPEQKFPIRFWCEVYLKNEWIPVDPITGTVNCTDIPSVIPHSYIIACEEGFGIKDVTRRYCHAWGATTSRMRSEDWWKLTLWLYSKSSKTEKGYWKLIKDLLDDANLVKRELNEKMPTNLAGFLNHPLYVLERHLKKNEAIYPYDTQKSLGVYKKELVFPRALVKQVGFDLTVVVHSGELDAGRYGYQG